MSDFSPWTDEQIDRERAESLRVHCILAQGEVDRLSVDIAAKDAEIERLRKGYEAARRILSSIMPEQVPGPFICGAIGQPGDDGLHDGYMICPTYGADHRCTVLYRRQG